MFIKTRRFPFVARLEARWTEVRDECMALAPDSYEPWVQRQMVRGSWDVYGLVAFGHRVDAALAACPRTAALLAEVPGLTTAGFSRMAAGTHITPHVGWVRTVYRLHMGLVVPPGCELRVGTQTQAWRVGECLIFDDTVEHEAWNRSQEDRVVLLLDFLRPGVDPRMVDVPPPEVQAMIARKR